MEKVLNKIYEWIDKIGKHNFMLLVFILIVTIVTSLYTTFSIMTSTGPSEFIDGLLTYKFILNADSDTNSVTIAAGSSKLLDITVSNEEKTKLQYGIYYSATEDINIGYVKNSTYPSTGLIEGKQNYIVTIKVDNNTNNDVTINFGLSFGLEKGGDLVLPEGSTIIGKYIEYGNAAKFVKSLYEDGSTINTVHIAGNTSKPQVHLNSTQGIMLDNNGDYRYYGASPNNYVDFNGELWRIISVSNVKSSEEDTTGETRVRIIKDTSIGYYAWNTGGTNNWADAILMCQLNTMYYNDTVPACTGKSLTSLNTSLNTEAKSLIDNALWYLGGGDTSVLYADDHYSMERNNPGYGSNPTRWTGKVGIMYPSDYGYAADLSVCKVTGNNYDTDTTNCLNTDWLFNSEYQWLMSPYSGISNGAWYVDEAGFVSIGGGIDVDFENGVRPVAILKSDVVITGGKGTSDNPYKISGNSIEIDNGNDYVSDKSNVELKLNSTGNTKTMCISVNNSSCNNYIDFSNTYTLDWSSEEDGEKTVYVYYKDKKGNIIASMSKSIILDTTAPTDNSLVIEDGPALNRVLTISSTGADYMCFSNTSSESSDCINWVSYATSYNWKLSDGLGIKTVYAFFKDRAGNISSAEATKEVTEILAFTVNEDFSDTTFDSNITVSGSGSYPWTVTNGRFQSSNKNVSSSSSTSTIQFTPNADANLSFDYSVSSESGWDKLTITLTGSDSSSNTLVNAISGVNSGSITDISLTSGVTYTLTLTYTKDSSANNNDDTAYIDNLVIE